MRSTVSDEPAPHLVPSRRMRAKFLREVLAAGLPARPTREPVAVETELASLPPPARRLMTFMGVPRRPADWSFCARWEGRFRLSPDRPWMPCEVWQYDSSLEVARIFHMRLRFGGVVPTYVRDVYLDGAGRMTGRLLDLVPMAEDASVEVTTGELVTYLNDALLFAPSMLLGPGTLWSAVDTDSFDVTLTDRDTRVTARVQVDERGAITDFSTTDRFGQDPANPDAGLVRTRWTTPIAGWTVVGDRPRPTSGRAVWHFPGGDFCYAEFFTEGMELGFDLPPGRPPEA